MFILLKNKYLKEFCKNADKKASEFSYKMMNFFNTNDDIRQKMYNIALQTAYLYRMNQMISESYNKYKEIQYPTAFEVKNILNEMVSKEDTYSNKESVCFKINCAINEDKILMKKECLDLRNALSNAYSKFYVNIYNDKIFEHTCEMLRRTYIMDGMYAIELYERAKSEGKIF